MMRNYSSADGHILHLISSSGFFGAENVVLQLAEQIMKAGRKVTIGVFQNTLQPNLELAQMAEQRGIERAIFPCRGRYDRRTVSLIAEFVREHGVRIIHSHNYKSNYYARRCAALTGSRWVVTNHGRRAGLKRALYNFLDRRLVRAADRVLAVSGEIAVELERSGVDKRRIRIIDNGIDVERFYDIPKEANKRESLGVPPGALLIGSIGSLTAEKGHLFLLNAMKRVVKVIPNAVCLLVGNGPELKRLRELSIQLSIEGSVIFAGKRKDVPEILSHLDLFVLPSLDEGLPMALLEALAAGRPVISSAVGAVSQVIIDGVSGRLVPPADANAIADAIIFSLQNPDAAKWMASAGAMRVRQAYSAETMASRYLEVYSEVLVAAKSHA